MADTRLPNGQTLTESELERAKSEARKYVRRMLERACLPCSAHAYVETERAVGEIVKVYVAYGYVWSGRLVLTQKGEQERERIILELIETLEDLVYAYAAAAEKDEDDKALLVAWLKEQYNGGTTSSRISSRVRRIAERLDRLISKDALSNGFVASDLSVSTGAIVGIKGLRRLVETEVTRGWQHKWGNDHSDAMFVHVFRGSSYPCDICDSMVALGWQLVGNAQLPPYHPNCCCYAVYM